MAKPSIGAHLSYRVSGCLVREDASRGTGGKSRGLRGGGCSLGRSQGSTRLVGERHGRPEVLADGGDGTAQSGSAGCVYSLRRRAEGVSGSHRGDISKGAGAAVHRAFDPQQSEIRQRQRTQERGSGVEDDLRRADGGGGGAG